jgi:predicted TIM-barrel fold metal-dependent hydrolase
MHIFDAHFHIIAPGSSLIPNRGFIPAPFGVDEYLARVRPLGVTGGAVVAGSFQGEGQDWLIAALARLGPGWAGVAQLPEDTPETEILRLDGLGVRALRLNLYRGTHPSLAGMARLAQRAFETAGWHTELYLDASEIPHLAALLDPLPALCVDHLGLTRAGLTHLLRLVERGARIKATGFGRLDFPAAEALAAITRVNPGALIFGTDLPCTRAPRPFSEADIALIGDTLRDDHLVRAALRDNALALYRLSR